MPKTLLGSRTVFVHNTFLVSRTFFRPKTFLVLRTFFMPKTLVDDVLCDHGSCISLIICGFIPRMSELDSALVAFNQIKSRNYLASLRKRLS